MNATRIPESDHYYANTKWLLKLRWVAVVGQAGHDPRCDVDIANQNPHGMGNGLGNRGHASVEHRADALVSPLATAAD